MNMKKEVIGRGYSKRDRHTFEPDEKVTADEFREFVNKPPKGLVDGRDPYVRAKRYRRDAEAYLKSQGLLAPSEYPYVFHVGGRWRKEGLTNEEIDSFSTGIASMPSYVKKQGYELDSLPDLAARIIDVAWQIEHPIKGGGSNDVINNFMEISRLYTLFKVYLVVDKGRLRSDPIKSKVWEYIARDLMREHDWPNPKKTKEDIWQSIADSTDGPHELGAQADGITEITYYRDGNQLAACIYLIELDGKRRKQSVKLSKRSFLERYFLKNDK